MALGFLMEFIVAIAIGFGLTRSMMNRIDPTWSDWIFEAGNNFFAGSGLILGLGIWLEAARHKSPHSWGPGRWIWSTLAAFILLSYIFSTGGWITFGLTGRWPLPSWDYLLGSLHRDAARRFIQIASYGILAFGFTRYIARSAPVSTLDSREWVYRVSAMLLILTYLINVACRFLNI